MNQRPTPSLSSEASWFFLGRALSFVVVFFLPMVLARTLSVENFGLFQQGYLTFTLLSEMLQSGLRQSFFYFIPYMPERRSALVTQSVIIFGVLGLMATILIHLCSDSVAYIFGSPELKDYLPLINIQLCLMLISSPFETLLVIQKNAKKASMITFFSEVARGLCVIVATLLYKSVTAALMGLVVFSALRLILYALYLYQERLFSLKTWDNALVKRQIFYSLPIGLSGLVGSVSKKIEQVIVSFLMGSAGFAIYYAGRFQVPLVNTAFVTIGEVTLPKLVELRKNNNMTAFLDLWHKMILHMSYIGIGSFFLFQTVCADLIPFIFGETYAAGVPIFRVFLLLIFSNMLTYGLLLRCGAYSKEILYSNLLSAIVAVTVTYPLVKYFGFMGAALSAVLVFNTNAFSQIIVGARKLEIPWRKLYPYKALLSLILLSAGISAVIISLQDLILLENVFLQRFLRLALTTAAFGISYVILSHKLKLVDFRNDQIVQKLLNRLNKLIQRQQKSPIGGA